MSYLALFVSLPTKAATDRMRLWRAVKALGCNGAIVGRALYENRFTLEEALAAKEPA